MLGNALSRQGSLDSLSRISRYESNLRRHYHNVLKELRTLRKARRQADIFDGFGLLTKPRAKPKAESQAEPPREENSDAEQAAATEHDCQNADLTQSVATLLESIAPMKNANGEPDLSDLPIAEALQFYGDTAGPVATQGAAS